MVKQMNPEDVVAIIKKTEEEMMKKIEQAKYEKQIKIQQARENIKSDSEFQKSKILEEVKKYYDDNITHIRDEIKNIEMQKKKELDKIIETASQSIPIAINEVVKYIEKIGNI